jgi:hypothetical protein
MPMTAGAIMKPIMKVWGRPWRWGRTNVSTTMLRAADRVKAMPK